VDESPDASGPLQPRTCATVDGTEQLQSLMQAWLLQIVPVTSIPTKQALMTGSWQQYLLQQARAVGGHAQQAALPQNSSSLVTRAVRCNCLR
jgi:hypothetical protein